MLVVVSRYLARFLVVVVVVVGGGRRDNDRSMPGATVPCVDRPVGPAWSAEEPVVGLTEAAAVAAGRPASVRAAAAAARR